MTHPLPFLLVLQEGLRAARGGTHDALNSIVAGAVAGAVVAGHYQGAQFRLLGAVLWGPLCGLAHVANVRAVLDWPPLCCTALFDQEDSIKLSLDLSGFRASEADDRGPSDVGRAS